MSGGDASLLARIERAYQMVIQVIVRYHDARMEMRERFGKELAVWTSAGLVDIDLSVEPGGAPHFVRERGSPDRIAVKASEDPCAARLVYERDRAYFDFFSARDDLRDLCEEAKKNRRGDGEAWVAGIFRAHSIDILWEEMHAELE